MQKIVGEVSNFINVAEERSFARKFVEGRSSYLDFRIIETIRAGSEQEKFLGYFSLAPIDRGKVGWANAAREAGEGGDGISYFARLKWWLKGPTLLGDRPRGIIIIPRCWEWRMKGRVNRFFKRDDGDPFLEVVSKIARATRRGWKRAGSNNQRHS